MNSSLSTVDMQNIQSVVSSRNPFHTLPMTHRQAHPAERALPPQGDGEERRHGARTGTKEVQQEGRNPPNRTYAFDYRYDTYTQSRNEQNREEGTWWTFPHETDPFSGREGGLGPGHMRATQIWAKARAQLYGVHQAEGQSAEKFLLFKKKLFARLEPYTPDYVVVHLLTEQLRPHLRSRLRGLQCQNTDEFIQIAMDVENDFKEERNYNATNSRMSSYNSTQNNHRQVHRTTEQQNTPRTACRFCGEWHFHNQCPRNPYRQQGNAERAMEAQRIRPEVRRQPESGTRPPTNQDRRNDTRPPAQRRRNAD